MLLRISSIGWLLGELLWLLVWLLLGLLIHGVHAGCLIGSTWHPIGTVAIGLLRSSTWVLTGLGVTSIRLLWVAGHGLLVAGDGLASTEHCPSDNELLGLWLTMVVVVIMMKVLTRISDLS